MAGSPRYLELLDEFTTRARATTAQPDNPHDAFTNLNDAWYWFTQAQNAHTLNRVAQTALDCLTLLTFQDRPTILEDARRLHINKNAGYAGADNPDPWANFRLSTPFGVQPVVGVYIRMSDKYIRITNLRANPANERVGEAIEDTLRDLFAYALIATCLLEETP